MFSLVISIIFQVYYKYTFHKFIRSSGFIKRSAASAVTWPRLSCGWACARRRW